MVLSAHFDHVGTVGNNIFRGALDNGSGTTSLLYLTKKLKEYSDNNGLENDIIIAGFNGEEANLQGSKAFAKKIKNQYEKIYNINVDCIGYSKDTDLMIAGTYDVNKELIEAFSDALKDDFVWRNIPNEEAKSDNLSFENQGISAIEITQDGLKEVIHTLKDTVDVIDVDKLIKISYKVFDFVINNDGVIYDFDVEAYNAQKKKEEQELEEEREKSEKLFEYAEKKYSDLKFGEVVICSEGNISVEMSNLNLEVNKYEDIREKAKGFNLKHKKINDYEFEKFMAFYNNDKDIEHMEPEKIYKVDCTNDDMYSCGINYKSENEILYINIENSKKYREVERMEENITSWHDLIKHDDEDYELMVDKNDSNIILGVYYKKKIDGRNFFITVYFGKTNATSQEVQLIRKKKLMLW